MKLLIATGLYAPDIGGPATYTKMLEEDLPKHGFELVVVPFGIVRRYPKIIRHLMYLFMLLRLGRGCVAYYALDPVSVGVPVYLAHFLARKPYIVRIAGDYAWEQGQQRFGVTETLDEFLIHHNHRLPVRILQRIQTFVATRARAVVVPSEYMKGVVASWGVSRASITRIYSALHPLHVSESKEVLRERFGFRGLVITTAGRLVPWKGMMLLIELLPMLQKQLGEVTLVIIGDGPMESTLRERAHALGVAPQVRFVGRLSKDALGATISASDLFVLNTSYEGMSHQLIEVMDREVPIIATCVGGNPELIEDGVSGCLIPYNDGEALVHAIVRIVHDQMFRTTLITHAKRRASAFARQTVVDELASFVRKLFS